MQVTPLPDATSFLTAAAPVLERDTAANNLPLGVAQQLVDRPDTYAEAFFWVAAQSGRVVGAAMRTPPYPAILADPLGDGVIDAFVAAFADAHPDLPGVTANEPWASRFADAWTAAGWSISCTPPFSVTSRRSSKTCSRRASKWRSRTIFPVASIRSSSDATAN